MAGQATGLARAVAQFRIEDGAAAAPHAGMRELPRRESPDKRAPALGERREPALTAVEEEDWKEF
jgi:hypothetical protein